MGFNSGFKGLIILRKIRLNYPFAGDINTFSALVSCLWMTATDASRRLKFLFLSTFVSRLLKTHFDVLSLSMDVLYTGDRLRSANNEGGTLELAQIWRNFWQLQRWASSVSVPHAYTLPIPVLAPSKEWFWGRSLAGIGDLNPAAGMEFCLLWALCVIRLRSLRQADHSSRGDPPRVCVCPTVKGKLRKWEDSDPVGPVASWKKCIRVYSDVVKANDL